MWSWTRGTSGDAAAQGPVGDRDRHVPPGRRRRSEARRDDSRGDPGARRSLRVGAAGCSTSSAAELAPFARARAPPPLGPRRQLRCRRRTGCPTASHIRLTWCFRPSCSVSSTFDGARHRTVAGAVTPSSSSTPSASGSQRRLVRLALHVHLVDLLDAVARMREPVRERAVVREQQRAGRVGVEPADRDDALRARRRARRPSAAPAGRWRSSRSPPACSGARRRAAAPRRAPRRPRPDRPRSTKVFSCPGSPLTVTRPALISSSAPRRDATPARAR